MRGRELYRWGTAKTIAAMHRPGPALLSGQLQSTVGHRSERRAAHEFGVLREHSARGVRRAWFPVRTPARKLALRDELVEAALADWHGPLARVDYAALNADWRGEIARTYDALGVSLTPAALAAMEAEQARAARDGHHAHAGDLARFIRD